MVSDHHIIGIHYKTGQVVNIAVSAGIIKSISAVELGGVEGLPLITPGLVDLQVNGFKGIDFNSANLLVNDVVTITKSLLAQGVTTYLPTVITNSTANIKRSLTIIAQACNKSALVKDCVGGIHLEGPFISPQDGPVGAHDKQFVQAPNWPLFQEFQKTSGNRIKIVTLSPEWLEAASFTRRCVAQNVIVSIGHTAANSIQIAEVVNAGASMSTHLGNGTHQVLPRHPNYIWDQLANDQLYAGFIGDGFHLPPAVIKVILRVKGDRAILVSDSVSLAGMPPGNYREAVGGNVVLTQAGKLHLADRADTLAGSAQTLIQAVSKLCMQNLCDMAGAFDLASANPAVLLKMKQREGLQEGTPADLILFNQHGDGFQVTETYKNGVLVYAAGNPLNTPTYE
jgi:N-acetylglucosamine-6-phosphate deacetylase